MYFSDSNSLVFLFHCSCLIIELEVKEVSFTGVVIPAGFEIQFKNEGGKCVSDKKGSKREMEQS